MRFALLALVAALPALAAADFTPGSFLLERTFPALTFTRPTDMHEVPDGSGRIFVLERGGKIVSFLRNDPTAKTTVLDLTAVTGTFRDDALMSIAFDPDFATNGNFFIHYSRASVDTTIPSPNRISRFTLSPPSAAACDPATEFVVLEQPTVFRDHKGGTITFGPDGYLYVAFGDGGSKTGTPPPPDDPLLGTDPLSQDIYHTAQDRSKLLGKVLRIDVRSTPDAGLNYAVPADNPYVGQDGVRPEIWAYGFRNPWRMAFDPNSGRLILGDVGWKQFDELNEIKPGRNYGWSMQEGTACFPPAADCTLPENYEAPLWVRQFPGTTFSLSITGGFFWESDRLPWLKGTYIFGDYVQGDVYAMRYDGATAEVAQLMPKPATGALLIAAFGTDSTGEVYALAYNTGGIYRLIVNPAATATPTLSPTPLVSDTPTATASPTRTPVEPTVTATPEPSPTMTPEPTQAPTPEPSATPTAEPSPTTTPEPTATATPEPTPTLTPEPTPEPTREPSPTPTAEPSPTRTAEPTVTATPEPSPTATPEPSPTATPEPSPTATPEPSPAVPETQEVWRVE